MSSLLKSRKFWLAMFDLVVSLVLFFVGKYANFVMEDVQAVIVAIQPVFVILIGAIAYEDGSGNTSAYNKNLINKG